MTCPFQTKITATVGGVAQWLGCRSLAGGLSLLCACSMADRRPLSGYTCPPMVSRLGQLSLLSLHNTCD